MQTKMVVQNLAIKQEKKGKMEVEIIDERLEEESAIKT